jgi:hypothetical protein
MLGLQRTPKRPGERLRPDRPHAWPVRVVGRRLCSDGPWGCAELQIPCYYGGVQVVLRKLGRGGRTISGRLVRAPRKGSVIVIEFSDGMHEYVTTPVRRVLKLAGGEVFYIETMNSRYRLEIRTRELALDDVMGSGAN